MITFMREAEPLPDSWVVGDCKVTGRRGGATRSCDCHMTNQLTDPTLSHAQESR